MRWVRVLGPEDRDPDGGPAHDPADVPGSTDTADAGSDDAGSPPEGAILVTSDDGEKFALSLDDALRDAVLPGRSTDESDAGRTDPTPAGPAVTTVPLTPREIQVRVRAGEAPDDLVEPGDAEYERVMRFASPVLEERLRIGDEARRSRARRDGDGALVPFADSVDSRFLAHGIDPASVSWDSFRRPDGTWVVTATWRGGRTGESERSAHWAFSLTARTVLAVDETASDLLSDRPLRPVVRAVPDRVEPDDAHGDSGAGASDEVFDEVFDQETPAGYRRVPERARDRGRDRSEEVVRTPYPDAPPLPLRLAEPLPDGDEMATRRPRLSNSHTEDHVDESRAENADPPRHDTDTIAFDELFAANLDEPDERRVPDERSVPGVEDGADEHGGRRPGSGPPDTTTPSPEDVTSSDSASTDDRSTPSARGGGRSKAAREQTKIPSWDDILLGVRRKQD